MSKKSKKKHSKKGHTSRIYGNCKLYSPNNTFMGFTKERKCRWYIKRGLAEKIDDNTYKLLFEPKKDGHAYHPYYLIAKENKCVVCGVTDKLTRHHVVPYCYRKFMEVNFKAGCAHDVLPVCVSCHNKYDFFQEQLRKELAKEYNAPIDGVGLVVDKEATKVSSAAQALVKHRDQIPQEKINELWSTVREYLGDVSIGDLEKMRIIQCDKSNYKFHGEIVVASLDDCWKFIEMWRLHFLEKMKPQHMPKGWDVKHRDFYSA